MHRWSHDRHRLRLSASRSVASKLRKMRQGQRFRARLNERPSGQIHCSRLLQQNRQAAELEPPTIRKYLVNIISSDCCCGNLLVVPWQRRARFDVGGWRQSSCIGSEHHVASFRPLSHLDQTGRGLTCRHPLRRCDDPESDLSGRKRGARHLESDRPAGDGQAGRRRQGRGAADAGVRPRPSTGQKPS